jgi:pimeloyl-ACP methyl ester carboxylesterase/DNA-binding CsgD family transcriptional regulator
MRLGAADSTASQALVIFLDAACSYETLALMESKFGLTSTEVDVVSAFSSGKSLKDIAADKHRSYATIRNQFQSALEKTGCPNQGDLLRMLLGVSYLLSYAAMATVNEDKPLGRKVEVMRPHGRFVEVRLYGDTNGKPFIVLPSLFGMSVTPDIEKKLYEHSLFMIGVWRPGFAGTSCPPKGMSTYKCLADDVTTVLDNLGIDHCPVLGRVSSARSVFKLASLVPERISKAFIANSMVPRRYVEKNNIKSRWTSALVLASRFSPSLAVLILETGQKLMLRHGAERFCWKMYSGSSADQHLLADPVIANAIFEGAKLATAPGMEASAQDVLEGFDDWSSEVLTVQKKVTLLQGCSDPHISIEASRAFAADFPDHIELVEFADGGGLLSYTHIDEILNAIEASCLAQTK